MSIIWGRAFHNQLYETLADADKYLQHRGHRFPDVEFYWPCTKCALGVTIAHLKCVENGMCQNLGHVRKDAR